MSILIGLILLTHNSYHYLFPPTSAQLNEPILYMYSPVVFQDFFPNNLLYGTLVIAGISTIKFPSSSHFLYLVFASTLISKNLLNLAVIHAITSDLILAIFCIYGLVRYKNLDSITFFNTNKTLPLWLPITLGVVGFLLSNILQAI